MSDHYFKEHSHDPMGGTPHIEDELNYRLGEHLGRDTVLSDLQFQDSYPSSETHISQKGPREGRVDIPAKR